MNKTIHLMQKVKTVKRIAFFMLILLTVVSCQKEQQSDDQQLLELVLQEKQNQSNRSIYLNPIGENKTVRDFFRFRNTENTTFRFANHDNSKTKMVDDSIYVKYDTIIYEKKKITHNDYLMNGKGVDKELETFLKDSFNYKQERVVTWLKPVSINNISLNQDNSNKENVITISTPVYNLDKNKAIIKTFYRSSRNTAQHSIHFIEKNKDSWTIIYSEKGDMFLDLKIE